MLSKSESKQEKAYLLNHYLESLGNSIQTNNVRKFEKINTKRRNREGMNAQELCDLL
jgi:oligoendopeptidase F